MIMYCIYRVHSHLEDVQSAMAEGEGVHNVIKTNVTHLGDAKAAASVYNKAPHTSAAARQSVSGYL